jgi:hypothetical protein
MDGVMEKLRSILRFLGLAAFILGPLWFLLMYITGGNWLSGMIGITLALVGYIILRVDDEEKRWKGCVLRAARWAVGKIRTWPFWIQCGLLSVAIAAILFFGGFIGGLNINEQFGWLVLAIFAPMSVFMYFTPLPIDMNVGHFSFLVGYWFIFGSLVGKVTESSRRSYRAFLILWSIILVTLGVCARVFLESLS